MWARPNASSYPGDPPAPLRLIQEPAIGRDGGGEARLREVRRHSEFKVDTVALLAPPRVSCVELLEHQQRVQPTQIVDVAGLGSPVAGVSGAIGSALGPSSAMEDSDGLGGPVMADQNLSQQLWPVGTRQELDRLVEPLGLGQSFREFG